MLTNNNKNLYVTQILQKLLVFNTCAWYTLLYLIYSLKENSSHYTEAVNTKMQWRHRKTSRQVNINKHKRAHAGIGRWHLWPQLPQVRNLCSYAKSACNLTNKIKLQVSWNFATRQFSFVIDTCLFQGRFYVGAGEPAPPPNVGQPPPNILVPTAKIRIVKI